MSQTIIPSEARSGLQMANLQELIDAGVSAKHATLNGQQQYETPPNLADFFSKLLPSRWALTAFDPQCAKGNLLQPFNYSTVKFGWDIDNRMEEFNNETIRRVTCNCVNAWEILEDCFPNLEFDCQVANPPFGLIWKTDSDARVDSTDYTWRRMIGKTAPNGYGYFIANSKTIERLKIDQHKWVYLYLKFPVGVWKNCDVEIGVVFYHASDQRIWANKEIRWECFVSPEELASLLGGTVPNILKDVMHEIQIFYKDTPARPKVKPEVIAAAWEKIQEIIDEEEKDRPNFNIYLNEKGFLRTYLSVRFQTKRKLKRDEVVRISKVDKCHPLALTVEKETRKLMNELITCGIYTIQPEAKAAIESALREVNSMSCPIMPITDFERVAYVDEGEDDALKCLKSWNGFTAGKVYPFKTATYNFTEKFSRRKPHYSETTGKMFVEDHDCSLTGQDKYIAFKDDRGLEHKFMDRPNKEDKYEHAESMLWEIFEQPVVKTICDVAPEVVERNRMRLKTMELLADFTYYQGQLEYIARMGVKNYGLVGAATGTGKSLMALSLIQLKAPKRALIIAPQGTMRSSEDDEGDDETEFNASQWVQEIRRFAPSRPVFELFSFEDYDRILRANNGQLPPGIFITYYQAMFQNEAMERVPDTWTDTRLCTELSKAAARPLRLPPVPADAKDPDRYWCESIGTEVNGIRCVISPCMASVIGQNFDMVCVDEAHICCKLNANVTQMLIRMQPKFRFAFTATPIPNLVTDMVPILGWLCVDGWYKGNRRNAAFPYAREDLNRVVETFLAVERDFTQEEMNKAAAAEDRKKGGKGWKTSKCEKTSPVISSPARLLKIVKRTMGYISKEQCNPDYRPPKIIDVRVPLGEQQTTLYAHFLNRRNIDAANALVRARKQGQILRNICADPHGLSIDYPGAPRVPNNMNPKTIAIMELVRDIVKRGEQFVIISARVKQTNTYEQMLTEAGLKLSRIDSTTGAEFQSGEANRFKRKETQGMLMGIKCAAAFSFHECPNEIIGSIEYYPGPFEQAKGRIDRVNSKYPTSIWCVLHKATMEETMFDTVATKDDAAKICLLGKRVPREFKPVDMGEVLANTILNFKDAGKGIPEADCKSKWPDIRDEIRNYV